LHHYYVPSVPEKINHALKIRGILILTTPNIKSYYSYINDLTYIDADQEDYLRVKSYKDLIRITIKRPTKTDILRTLAYPLVKLKPSLRQSIIIVATKVKESKAEVIERW
jgi:hypothetical protein